MPNSGLQLMEELIIFNLVKVKVIGLFGIQLDAIIQLFAKVFASALFKLSEPELNLFISFINPFLEGGLTSKDVVNGTHEVGEEDDT